MQSESRDQGVEVVAVNILDEQSTLADWKEFWAYVGGGKDVLFAQDVGMRAVAAFNIRALGATIIINREGQIAYRDVGPTPYKKLRSEVDKVL